MTQAEQRFDENSSAAQAEIERLKQELSHEHDLRLRALADFDNYRKRVQRERAALQHRKQKKLEHWHAQQRRATNRLRESRLHTQTLDEIACRRRSPR